MNVRLVGGPRDGEIVVELPEEYTVVGVEQYDVPVEGYPDMVGGGSRKVATWRNVGGRPAGIPSIMSEAVSLAAGEALESYAMVAISILNRLPGGHIGEAQPAKISAYPSIAAGCSHTLAMGLLLTSDLPVPPSVVALARTAVESFGRAWRILLPTDQEARDELAKALRSGELVMAWKKGLAMRWRDGSPANPEDVELPASARSEYAATAVTMLKTVGRSEAEAVAEYSFMSSIAHGESFGISSMTVDVDGRLVIGLSQGRTAEILRNVFFSMTYATGRFLSLYAPEELPALLEAETVARRRLAEIFE